MAQSRKSPFLKLAREGASVADAMDALSCSKGTAERGLREGTLLLERIATRESHIRVRSHVEDAVALNLHCGVVRPWVSRKRWTDVVLGLQGAA